MLSVGATFAADNATEAVAIDDEVTIDEPLAVEQDVQDVSANESTTVVVTPETVNQYISESGLLYDNVTADEMVFDGIFYNLNLTVERSIALTGGNFINPDFEILSSNVLLKNFTIVQEKGVSSIFVAGSEENHTSDVIIDSVGIIFEDDKKGAGAIPIDVLYSDDFILMNSYITYTGRTNGSYLNNAVRLASSKNGIIFNNTIIADLASVPVGWSEEPAGSGIWVSAPMSGAIVIKNSDGAVLDGNLINVTCGNASGDYDTIYTVEVSESDDVTITNNNIVSDGNSYIYGIVISGDDFTISGNNITSSAVLYANGIDIEGPATGVVENNNIDVYAITSAYAIYSGMNGKNVNANYTGNNITGEAYNIFGFSLGDVESNVKDNYIDLEGNYTTGLAARTGVLHVTGNKFVLTSSEEGNESVWEGFGVAARGILVITGDADIDNNTIVTSGTGVLLNGNQTNAVVGNNFINVVANEDKDAFAVRADDIAVLFVMNNAIDYQGTTQGTGVNNAILISETDEAIVGKNNFTLDLVSSFVPWIEEPAGSWHYVAYPVSEGIVVKKSKGVIFDSNIVKVTYGDIVGDYDTIYTVSFKESDDAVISNNNIDANGYTYIYGIQLSGNDFTIRANNITSTGVYYANGIDIEGPATGVVEDNVIDVNAVTSVYAIYSGMNGQDVSANYTGNNITGKAYNVFGFSLGDVESNIADNEIYLEGNYTTGIAYRGTNITATGNHIVLTSSEQGNETIWENFGVEAVGIKVINGTALIENNTIATPGKGIHIEGAETDAFIFDNFINVVANDDQNAYAVFAIEAANIFLNLNNIDYQGATKGTGINNAVYVNNVTETTIIANNFTLDLVSSYVPWFEVPSGSGNWVSFPISEGIVIEDTDKPVFSLNKVNVTYGDVVGAYDTIYAVDVKTDNALITDNEINAKGHTYIYGLIISGENFTVEANNITSESDNYYANGIDIEGPATGVVKDNGIIAKGPSLAYPVYSGMNGQNVSVNYTGNDIVGDAYLVIGMSLGDVESNIADSGITVNGNYTTGIAYRGSKLTVDNTQILSNASNVGDEDVWEAFGTDTAGIKVVQGNSTITNNNIQTTADYAIDVKDTAASVHDNYLLGKKFAGDDSVSNAANSEVYNNTPVIENKTATMISITEVYGNCNITGILTDVDGNPIVKDTINYSVDGVNYTTQTDDKGIFRITNLTNAEIKLSFAGDSFLLPSNATIVLKDIAPARESTVIVGNNFTQYALDYKSGERGQNFTVQLIDANGNILANKTILIGYNGKVLERVTNATGHASVQINLKDANRLTFAVSFLGDEQYNATMSVYLITINKKPVTISAPAKTYKVSAKTKKYTVTLKTIVGSSADGKIYFGAGKKVTMKINGKTYTAKTNAKGQATFSLKITKKGKYSAVIKYAGDNTYKAASKSVKITIK